MNNDRKEHDRLNNLNMLHIIEQESHIFFMKTALGIYEAIMGRGE